LGSGQNQQFEIRGREAKIHARVGAKESCIEPEAIEQDMNKNWRTKRSRRWDLKNSRKDREVVF
jgi:hypothetical protein